MNRFRALLLLAVAVMSAALFAETSLAAPEMYFPTEAAVDGDGNVYVILGSGYPGAGVHAYAPDGRELLFLPGEWYADLAIGPDGSLYLSNVRENRLERAAPNGTVGVFWRDDCPGRFIDYFAIGPAGAFFVSDFNYSGTPPEVKIDGRIVRVSPEGAVTAVINGSPAVPMTRQFKMAISGNGTIYMTDSRPHVMAIYPDGSSDRFTLAGEEGAAGFQVVDVAVTGDDIYVTEATRGAVYKLAANGSVLARWDGCGPDRFVTPFGIAAADSGRIYVCDTQARRVVWLDAGRYRFGNDTAANVAGQGDLWGILVSADNATARPPWQEGIPVEGMPGFPAAAAFLGLCLAGGLLSLHRARRG